MNEHENISHMRLFSSLTGSAYIMNKINEYIESSLARLRTVTYEYGILGGTTRESVVL